MRLFLIFKTYKWRQKRDGLKLPKTHNQTLGQTHSQANLSVQKTHFQRVF
jgi:hypothetical protein